MNKPIFNFMLPSISSNKIKLEKDDYKIIKVMENFLMSLTDEELEKISSDYNVKELIYERRTIRAKINEAEESLNKNVLDIIKNNNHIGE